MAISPLPTPDTPNAALINFDLRGRVLEVINHTKFPLDRFRGYGAPGGRKSLFPIDWRCRLRNPVDAHSVTWSSSSTDVTCILCNCKSGFKRYLKTFFIIRMTYSFSDGRGMCLEMKFCYQILLKGE